MKKIIILTSLWVVSLNVQGQAKTKVDSISYIIGMSIGNNVLKDMPEANKDLLIQGLMDAMNKKAPAIIDNNNMVNTYFQKKYEEKQQEAEKLNQVTKLEGEKFLENNKKQAGVKVTPSGLQYMVLNEGKGPKPTATSKVRVHYHGTTPDGTVFDSSVDRGEPITFGLNQVIPGWTEGVQLMPVGSKFKFFIPQELAYGANPQPGSAIKPYMPLIFEVELLSIEP
jgi:FKBP-type peptidyl-prolyl cis-trans isomerase